jgi:peptide-methionine (S)-S-oxide reductase
MMRLAKTAAASKTLSRAPVIVLALGIALAIGALAGITRSTAEEARVIPPPAVDTPPASATSEVAVIAGGCFWGVQGVFQHTKGVTNALSGYAGGDRKNARYDVVSAGRTAHAEAVHITYDPRVISYGQILQIFFSVAHDPTQLNRQGPDHGPQYRSAIFPENAEQAKIAQTYIAQLDQARAFDKPIVTKIEAEKPFFPAEAYHQDYMTRNPGQPYIVINDLPKVASLKRLFPDRYRAEPALVSAASN